MTARSNLFLPAGLVGFVALSLCGLFVCSALASGDPSPNGKSASKTPLHVEVQDGQGVRIAGPETSSASSNSASAVLVFDRDYQPGDRIMLGGPKRVAIRVDESMPECLIFLPVTSQGLASYAIPYGREERQTGSAYAPESFAGKSHRVVIRTLTSKETTGYRNLALNPCDARVTESESIQFFPHASTNSVSRSLFDFEARNAIDGASQNGHHGIWPYQSWGPQLRTDLWWQVDFGRPVELNKIRLMVRADFPHDSFWKSADVEFSDGSHVPIQIGSSAEFQQFSFRKRRVSWLRLTNLVPSDPSKWCSFVEVEAWGRDLK
jgi:hypothetical protein